MSRTKNTAKLITEIPMDLHQWFKIYTIRNHTSMTAMIKDYLENLRRNSESKQREGESGNDFSRSNVSVDANV